jgi:hypothetical protein
VNSSFGEDIKVELIKVPPRIKKCPSGSERATHMLFDALSSSSTIRLSELAPSESSLKTDFAGLPRFRRAGPSTSLDKSPFRVIKFAAG